MSIRKETIDIPVADASISRRHIASTPGIARQTRDYPALHRAVVCHQWQTLAEWARHLDELGQLTDAEVEELACFDRAGYAACA